MKHLTLLAALLAMLAIQGCMIIKTDHAFVLTFAKTVDAEALAFIADSDETKIGSGKTKTNNDKIRIITPSGAIESTGE